MNMDLIIIDPSNSDGRVSSQVGGFIWYITFASNVWKDPEIPRNLTDIPGNWFAPTTTSCSKILCLLRQRLLFMKTKTFTKSLEEGKVYYRILL